MEGLNGHFVNIFLKTRPGRFVPIFIILVSKANIVHTHKIVQNFLSK